MRVLVVALSLAIAAPALAASPKTSHRSELDRPFTASRGEYAALAIDSLLTTFETVGKAERKAVQRPRRSFFDDDRAKKSSGGTTALLCVYSQKFHQLVFLAMGHTKTIDQAKAHLEKIRKKLLPLILTMLNQGFGIKVNDNEYRLIWQNLSAGAKPKPVIVWNKGQYVLP